MRGEVGDVARPAKVSVDSVGEEQDGRGDLGVGGVSGLEEELDSALVAHGQEVEGAVLRGSADPALARVHIAAADGILRQDAEAHR